MKKLFGLAAIALLAFGVWKLFFAAPNMERAATRFSELCSEDDAAKFAELVKSLPAREAYDCMMDAGSCTDGIGCLAGLQARESLRGMQRAFE